MRLTFLKTREKHYTELCLSGDIRSTPRQLTSLREMPMVMTLEATDDERWRNFSEVTPGATETIPVTITTIDGNITFAYVPSGMHGWTEGEGDFLDAGGRIAE